VAKQSLSHFSMQVT